MSRSLLEVPVGKSIFGNSPYRYVPYVSELYRAARRAVRSFAYADQSVYCLVCKGNFKSWRHQSCPVCDAAPRQKLAALTLSRLKAEGELTGGALLYFAPDFGMKMFLRDMGIPFTTIDIAAPDAEIKADATKLPLPDRSYRALMSSHVLEHIPDDSAAMHEMWRVLQDGGVAVVQVPLNQTAQVTDEDSGIADEAERTRRFGQHDHVRLYALDIVQRLQEAGFAVEVSRPVENMSAVEAKRLGLWSDVVFICRKSRSSSAADERSETERITQAALHAPWPRVSGRS